MSDYSMIKASAPGSIMLMGEHAVVRGAQAIACAVNRYIHVELTPRDDDQVFVHSELGDYRATLHELPDAPDLQFVVATLRQWLPSLPSGLELRIESEFSHRVGLGSSAAVVAALTFALDNFAETGMSNEQMFDVALKVIHEAQNGRGSGTDLAASIYGGLIAYRVVPRELIPLQGLPELSLWYVGYKMKTPAVLELVERKAAAFPSLYASLDRLMEGCSLQARLAIEMSDWQSLGELMNFYQGLLDTLGVNDGKLSELVYRLRATEGVYGAKISGSGLGDCVVALGAGQPEDLAYEQIAVAVSAQGATCTRR
ncbi:mevalonate kinase [Marinobacterium zhoushanense]|uniref:Mevalonate kinase n=1 Tax=Marinobacterium zhoushanense TaxID=1679163 RepID=A0ABQ1K363_9GAMM|nr:mevalonate kinase [Marinobacterium zhoushanense]GGB82985.1 mevalonate kinase [Marinobacterium zhoushanense]